MKTKSFSIAVLLLAGSWLNNAYAQYPVSAHISPSADSYVRDGAFANTNYGISGGLETRWASGSGNNREVYFTYDVSQASPTVQSVKIRIYGGYSGAGWLPVGLYTVSNTAWAENAITWNNKPATSFNPLTTIFINSTNQFWEFDVTNYVKNQRLAGKTAVSFALKHQVQSALATWSAKEAFFQYPVMDIINVYVGKEEVTTSIQSNEAMNTSELDVYPNPAAKNVTLNFVDNQSEQVAVSIFDLSSREVATYKISSQTGKNTIELNLPQLENGVYFLSLQTNEKAYSQRIVIQN